MLAMLLAALPNNFVSLRDTLWETEALCFGLRSVTKQMTKLLATLRDLAKSRYPFVGTSSSDRYGYALRRFFAGSQDFAKIAIQKHG